MKCKHYDIDRDGMFCALGKYRKGCAKNTDKDCNIIKPKSHIVEPNKMVRVKAWAAITRDGEIYAVRFEKLNYQIYKPITILIDKKYLKGK